MLTAAKHLANFFAIISVIHGDAIFLEAFKAAEKIDSTYDQKFKSAIDAYLRQSFREPVRTGKYLPEWRYIPTIVTKKLTDREEILVFSRKTFSGRVIDFVFSYQYTSDESRWHLTAVSDKQITEILFDADMRTTKDIEDHSIANRMQHNPELKEFFDRNMSEMLPYFPNKIAQLMVASLAG